MLRATPSHQDVLHNSGDPSLRCFGLAIGGFERSRFSCHKFSLLQLKYVTTQPRGQVLKIFGRKMTTVNQLTKCEV